MNNVPTETKCWGCKKLIPTTDRYCKYCGRGQGKNAAWYYHHWGIIALTLFALGPLALFFVLRSPILGKRSKWIYTIIIVLMTAYLAKVVYHFYLVVESMFSWIL